MIAPTPRRLAFAALALALATTGCRPSTPQWPTDAWPTSTPEAEGIDPAAIDSLLADLDAGRYGLIDHFLLVRHGRVVADRSWDHAARYAELLAAQPDTADHQYNYDHPAWHPFYRDTRLHSLQSVTKSVMSVAFGIAVDEGHVPGVESPAWPYLEAYRPDMTDPRRAAATVEDFLTMRSGIAWALPGQTYDDDEHPTVVLEASDQWIAYATSRPMAEEPGASFDYNDGVSVLLGKIVREATGMRMDAWAEERLFRPIGIDEYYWKVTPDGEADTEGGLYLATHDLARIAYLMRVEGGDHGVPRSPQPQRPALPVADQRRRHPTQSGHLSGHFTATPLAVYTPWLSQPFRDPIDALPKGLVPLFRALLEPVDAPDQAREAEDYDTGPDGASVHAEQFTARHQRVET